jgi:hypothetical protein
MGRRAVNIPHRPFASPQLAGRLSGNGAVAIMWLTVRGRRNPSHSAPTMKMIAELMNTTLHAAVRDAYASTVASDQRRAFEQAVALLLEELPELPRDEARHFTAEMIAREPRVRLGS